MANLSYEKNINNGWNATNGIQITCGHCNKPYPERVNGGCKGQSVQCPNCQEYNFVPK